MASDDFFIITHGGGDLGGGFSAAKEQAAKGSAQGFGVHPFRQDAFCSVSVFAAFVSS